MRKVNLLTETWREYTRIFTSLIPESLKKKFETKKKRQIVFLILAAEVIAALTIYWLWLKTS